MLKHYKVLQNLFLILFSSFLTLFLLEISFRIYYKEGLSCKNYLEEELAFYRFPNWSEYDPLLGWIPKEGKRNQKESPLAITILKDGIRSNGSVKTPLNKKGTILAAGDSFTFCTGVSDQETWPSQLERLLSKKVINAGVYGYGLDQTFLRAEILANQYKPDTLIFSFIPDDIFRCQSSKRCGASKPYFRLSEDNKSLARMNTPVPKYTDKGTSIGAVRKAFGYSFLANKVMMKLSPPLWLKGDTEVMDRIHHEGAAISCLLLQKLSELQKSNNINKIYVLILYPKNMSPHKLSLVGRLKSKCLAPHIEVVDLREPLLKIRKNNKERYERLLSGHMSAEGNLFIAKILAEKMKVNPTPY